jgi:hypothetical protein
MKEGRKEKKRMYKDIYIYKLYREGLPSESGALIWSLRERRKEGRPERSQGR